MTMTTIDGFRETIEASKTRLRAIYARLEKIRLMNFAGISADVISKYQSEVNELGKEIKSLTDNILKLRKEINGFFRPASAC